jgi:parvulin-like peptidyl-prolyl isomerase
MAGPDAAGDPGSAEENVAEGSCVTGGSAGRHKYVDWAVNPLNRTVFVVQKLSLVRLALAALTVLALSACAALTGTGDPNVAATVEGTEVLVSEVEERFEQAKTQPQVAQQLEADTSGAFQSQLQAQILTQLVLSQLLEQWAEELNITATDQDVADERDALIEQLGGQEAFDQAVEESGLSEEDVNDQIRQRVLQNKIADSVSEDVDVTDEEIAQFYEENAEARFGPKATARHILVKKKAKADQIMSDIEGGADFAKIAKKESTDTGSAQNGGELPEFGRGQMVGPFEDAVFEAKAGELVGPVKTEFGYHIIEVLKKSEGKSLEDASEEIRKELSETQEGELLQKTLGERTKEAEVTVNPRFGTWNPESQQVEPSKPLGETSESPAAGGSELPIPGGDTTELPPIPSDVPTE